MDFHSHPPSSIEQQRRLQVKRASEAIAHFLRADAGATLVEYALTVGLILLSALASMQFLGVHLSTEFSAIGSALSSSF